MDELEKFEADLQSINFREKLSKILGIFNVPISEMKIEKIGKLWICSVAFNGLKAEAEHRNFFESVCCLLRKLKTTVCIEENIWYELSLDNFMISPSDALAARYSQTRMNACNSLLCDLENEVYDLMPQKKKCHHCDGTGVK